MIAPEQNITVPPKLLLTTAQTCEALSVCRRTLYQLTQPRGPIPCIRIGNQGIRYSVAAIEKWIANQEREAQAVAQ